jgi:hypothetical protein
MNEDDPKLQEFRDWLNQIIGTIVAKYAGRVVWFVGGIAFAAGVWATKMQVDIANIRDTQTEAKRAAESMQKTMEATATATTARIVDWSQWRVLKDAADDNYERRLAWLETVERTRQ